MLARRGGSHFPLEDKVWRNIPDRGEEAQAVAIKEYLDADVDEASRVPDKVLRKWGRLFDIVKPSSQRSCCFTRGYRHLVERSGSILQEAEELDVRVVTFIFGQALTFCPSYSRRLGYLTSFYYVPAMSPSYSLSAFAISVLRSSCAYLRSTNPVSFGPQRCPQRRSTA